MQVEIVPVSPEQGHLDLAGFGTFTVEPFMDLGAESDD